MKTPLLYAGIDEAGRGPVIGPMVIAIVAGTDEDLKWMKELRIRDSKLIRAKERDALSKEIRARCWHEILIIDPTEIDTAVNSDASSLNILERDGMRSLIRAFQDAHADSEARIMADAIGRYADRYARALIEGAHAIPHHEIRSECKADANHLIVGAASIVAKTERECRIAEIRDALGIDFGSGYCSDPKTKAFLASDDLPREYIRWSWATMQKR